MKQSNILVPGNEVLAYKITPSTLTEDDKIPEGNLHAQLLKYSTS